MKRMTIPGLVSTVPLHSKIVCDQSKSFVPDAPAITMQGDEMTRK